MAEINVEMQNTTDKIKQVEAVKDFYELFLPYYQSMKNMVDQLEEAKNNLESLLN